MAAAASDHEEVLAGDESVDLSSLKVPTIKWEGAKVASGEEDDELVHQTRARLFIWSGGEWKERGVGDIKILKNKTTGLRRAIMRQDKTLKVRCNHKIAPDAALTSHGGSDKAWVWLADDFADDVLVKTKFAASFKNKDVAVEFKAAYEAASKENAALFAKGVHGNAPAPSTTTSTAASGGAGGPLVGGGGAVGGAGASSSTAAVIKAAEKPKEKDESGPVPSTDKYEDIYGAEGASEAAIRYGALTEAFKREFSGSEPTFYVRAPGRVNLIGEHIDYHGYSVLPMALGGQDVVIAVAANFPGGPVKVANTDGTKYPAAKLPANPAAEVDRADGVKWYQYVQCGYKGAFDAVKDKGIKAPEPKGVYMMVDGRVPPGAGVSSSSALTVASLLAVAHANGIDAATGMTRADLGESARKCELYIGTMSGGMDQAISCLATKGSAARIDFEPLKATNVALPAGAVFVVSNTLEESAKAVDAEKRYNKRVTEGKLAAKLVAKGEGLANWASIQTLRELQAALSLPSPGALLPAIEKHLRPAAYSLADLSTVAVFGADPATLFEGDGKKAGALRVLDSLKESPTAPAFELLKRARHVASESDRVFAFQAACEGKVRSPSGATSALEGGVPAQLAAMGRLMNESHASCRDDYECSSEGLDALTALAVANGAFGSRLTGAGWGGCAVSLVPVDKVDAFVAALKSEYYAKRGKNPEGAVFVSAPGTGAAVYNPPSSFEI